MSPEHEKLKTPTATPLRRNSNGGAAPALDHDLVQTLRRVQRIAGNRGLTELIAQRRTVADPRPLVQRAPSLSDLKSAVGLGKKKSAAAKAEKAGFKSGQKQIATVEELEKQISTLEAALAKLQSAQKGGKADKQAVQQAAVTVGAAAERILVNLENTDRNRPEASVPRSQAHRIRLRLIASHCTSIHDELQMATTKKQAGDIYMKAGVAAAPGGTGAPKAGAFGALSGDARTAFGKDEPPMPQELKDKLAEYGFTNLHDAWEDALAKKNDERLKTFRGFGGNYTKWYESYSGPKRRAEKFGLSHAEFAAIYTYSVGDFTYINPATANDPGFMIDQQFKSLDDAQKSALKAQARTGKLPANIKKDLGEKSSEGTLHTGMFLQGVMKLKPWPGKLYRGESWDDAKFQERYSQNADGTAEVKRNPEKMLNITSMSTKPSVTAAFTGGAHSVFKEVEVTNGRDIGPFTAAGGNEAEVVLLPGALIYYESAEMKHGPDWSIGLRPGFSVLHVKGKQIR